MKLLTLPLLQSFLVLSLPSGGVAISNTGGSISLSSDRNQPSHQFGPLYVLTLLNTTFTAPFFATGTSISDGSVSDGDGRSGHRQ